MSRRLMLVLLFGAYALLGNATFAHADPVGTFIDESYEISTSGDAAALAAYIAENPLLVGAAVGQLLDVAIEVGDGGDTDSEKENVDFALLIARVYKEGGGSAAPHDLAVAYGGWSADQRAERAKANELEARAVAARDGGDFAGADGLFIQAKEIYDQIGDGRSTAVTWGSMGVNAWYAGDFESVMSYYNEALAARRAIDDQILVGKTLNGLGSANKVIGELETAAEWYGQAVELRSKTGDIDGYTKSVTYLSDVYLDQGRYMDARQTMEQAVPYLSQAADVTEVINAHTTIGNIYSSMGNYPAANDAYSQAVALAREAGDGLREGIALNNRAGNFLRHYRFREAFADLEQAQPLLEASEDVYELSLVHRNFGLGYRMTGQLELATEELLAARKLAEESGDAGLTIEALTNLSLLYQDLGALDRGLKVAQTAMTMAADAGDGGLWTSAASNAATLLNMMGRYDESLELWAGVIEQAEYDGAMGDLVHGKISAGNVHNLRGESEKARALYADAYTLAEGSNDADALVTIAIGYGHSYEKSDPAKAFEYYEKALDDFEAQRKEAGAQSRTTFLSGERRAIYEGVSLYYASLDESPVDGEWSARGFEVIERAKARGLLEQLNESLAGETSAQEAEALDAMYARAADDPERDDMEKRYLELRNARIEAATSGLAFEAASIADVQKALPKKAVLMQYALGDSASLLWVVDRDHYELFELPNRAALIPEVERMRDAVTRPGSGDGTLRNTARSLYVALLAPAADRIKKAETVVIVPDGELFGVPFEALLTEEPNGSSDWSEAPFLARDHATLYAPSASVFVALREKEKRQYERELLALGDADFTTLASRPGVPVLEPLPYTRDEVNNISKNVKKDSDKTVLLGDGARESALKSELRNGSPRILHLATHGLVDAAEPSASSIALSADGQDDGYFYTLEILAEPMGVELVVVSACESATGKVSRSEGVVGLSRAFIASGAGGVVASLWAVSDESTAQLMTSFYDGMLSKKRPTTRALNDARLALLDSPDYAHPFYWSPFVVIGGPTTMEKN